MCLACQKRVARILLVAAGWVLAAATVCAQSPETKSVDLFDMPGKWWKHQPVVDELRLTPDQTAKIEAIFMEHRKKLVDLKAQLEKYMLDLEQTTDQSQFDRAQVLKLVDQIAPVRSEIVRSTILMQLDIRDQLNPNQRATLKKLRGTYRDRQIKERIQRRWGADNPPRTRPMRP